MTGYQVTFFTSQDRRHAGMPVADWLMRLAEELQLSGATVLPAREGMGHGGHLHSAHFFELADQPVSVLFALAPEESERLFARLATEGLDLFYVRSAVEFGVVGKD